MGSLGQRVTSLTGARYPVMQDALGTYKTAKLAAAVSEAGGLGTVSIPGTTVDPDHGAAVLREHIEETLRLTSAPFAVNIAVLKTEDGKVAPLSERYLQTIVELREDDERAREQLRVLTTSALFPAEHRDLIEGSGLVHFHKVGSTGAAVRAAERGADGIIAVGYEMGGHTHNRPVHTFVLVRNVSEAVDVPVIAGGGIRDGRGMAAAFCLGAEAVAMGTRFIASDGNGDWDPAYGDAVIGMREGEDITFPGVFGPVRGIRSKGVEKLRQLMDSGADTAVINAWKDQHFQLAQREGKLEEGLVPMGQVASGIAAPVRIGEFIPAMADEARALLADGDITL
ncbi:nitronate monooxygenase [Georgenia sp. 10Sc9-8]|uniref:Nitronate monooxygenase n=1 Tax=Georgenia halotolerans TaxID=3028317 RepID=A0ABT5TYU1_9MICO|nr:nitronate monooxygenase [Georgenia halotolerans]